jgi:hypothetical protein
MTYAHNGHEVGLQELNTTSTTQQHVIGKRCRGYDPVYGEAEFIYLKGVASTAVNDLVVYDEYNNTTTRATAGSRGPAAVAMSANVANQYGWYQISGAAIVNAATVLAGGNVYATATAGTVDDATVSGDKVDGARFKTADGTPAAGKAVVQLDRPAMNANG